MGSDGVGPSHRLNDEDDEKGAKGSSLLTQGLNLYALCDNDELAYVDGKGEGKIGLAIRVGRWGIRIIRKIIKDEAKRLYRKEDRDICGSKQVIKRMSTTREGLVFVVNVIRRGVRHFLGTHIALTMTASGLGEGTPVRLDYVLDDTAKVTRLSFSVGQWNEEVTRSKNYGCPDSLVEVASLERPALMGSVEFRFPAALKAKAVTSEIRVTLMCAGEKTVDIFAISQSLHLAVSAKMIQ